MARVSISSRGQALHDGVGSRWRPLSKEPRLIATSRNMRSYSELLSNDPAWPELGAAARRSERTTILPRDADAARSCLERLQVTTRSTLGALAHETGGLLVDHGWLRLFGCGSDLLRRALGDWNETVDVPLSDFVLVGDDVVGGAFAINGGALGSARGNVFYFAPDRLAWEDLHMAHSAFVHWTLDGDLGAFYENLRWPGWQQEVEQLGGDQVLGMYPFPWTCGRLNALNSQPANSGAASMRLRTASNASRLPSAVMTSSVLSPGKPPISKYRSGEYSCSTSSSASSNGSSASAPQRRSSAAFLTTQSQNVFASPCLGIDDSDYRTPQ